MISRRQLCVALASGAASPHLLALADQAPVMGSSVFDWNEMTVRPTDAGSMRSVCKSATATLDELEIHVTTLGPGKSPHPPHRHPNEELVILREGSVEAFENGEWKKIGPGSVIFSASNQLHGLRNSGSEPATYHVINWKSLATPRTAQS